MAGRQRAFLEATIASVADSLLLLRPDSSSSTRSFVWGTSVSLPSAVMTLNILVSFSLLALVVTARPIKDAPQSYVLRASR